MSRRVAWTLVGLGLLGVGWGLVSAPPASAPAHAPLEPPLPPREREGPAGVDPWGPLVGWEPYTWAALQREVEARLNAGDPAAGRALLEVWRGSPEAGLARVKGARVLRARLVEMEAHAARARAALQAGAVDEALAAGEEALALDGALWAARGVAHASGLRRALRTEVGTAALAHGRAWATRGQAERACDVWRRAYRLSAADAALNRALAWCSGQAARALELEAGCAGVARAARLATAGDGLERARAERARRLGCR